MEGNAWIDIPVVDAINYFQGILAYFLSFARKYGTLIGTIGLMWTAFRLINSRIGVKEMLWDTIYKWVGYLLMINFYAVVTSGIALLANNVGQQAGNGSQKIAANFDNLRKSIKKDLSVFDNWKEDMEEELSSSLGTRVTLQTLSKDSNDIQNTMYVADQVNEYISQLPKNNRKEIEKKMADKFSDLPDKEQSIWGEQTLQALDSILIQKGTDGKVSSDLTNSYVDLDIWLKNDGKDTPYFSCSAIYRIGLLTGQILWEKAQMFRASLNNKLKEEGVGWFKRRTEVPIQQLFNMVLAAICFLAILASSAFAIIQYSMCIIEFSIIQGIGAFFIPFYLFDGTKDLPKKLVPVFTGFLIKIIVMVICLMFIINLWLDLAMNQLRPEAGSMGWVTVAEVLFTCLLSFILTSNAPKIAMTLLTGQPQLSMGEFMAAAGTMAAGAMMAKNAAVTVASPFAAKTKQKIQESNEQKAAGKAAGRKAAGEFMEKEKSRVTAGMDTSTREGRLAANKKWSDYQKEHGKRLQWGQAASAERASNNAIAQVQEQQLQNRQTHGGAAGDAGRMLAHYTGAAINIGQTLRNGRPYQEPQSGVDINRILKELNTENEKPTPSPPQKEESKKGTEKNGLPENLTGGQRTV